MTINKLSDLGATFLVLLYGCASYAQDSCRDILTNGFYNEYSKSSDHARDQAMYAELCSSNFEQAQNIIKRAEQSGAGGSVGVSYGLFSVSGGGSSSSGSSFSEEQFNQWKSQYCSKNSSSDSSRAANFLMQKTVSESVVDAWSTCIQNREGLACFAIPYHEEVLLNISWKKASLTRPEVQASFLTNGVTAQFDGTPAGRLLPATYKLSPGTLQIPLVRPEDQSIVANLNVNHDGVAHSCGVFVPGAKDFELTKPTLAQQSLKSPDLGCKAQAAPFGKSCGGTWPYTAPLGYKVCTVEISFTNGPTEGAEVSLQNPTLAGGAVKWSVERNETLSGAGRWIYANAVVTYVPLHSNARDDSHACTPDVLAKL